MLRPQYSAVSPRAPMDAALLGELHYVDDERLQILIDHSAHFDAEASAAGVDLDSDWGDWLAGERTLAAASRQVLAERAARGYRYEPGRMLVSRELLDEIRQRIDLPALMTPHVALRRAGRSYVGHCPFHCDTRPSLHVYPDGRYWCYGCNAHGDVFSWLMAIDRLQFRDAVMRAAALAGLVRA